MRTDVLNYMTDMDAKGRSEEHIIISFLNPAVGFLNLRTRQFRVAANFEPSLGFTNFGQIAYLQNLDGQHFTIYSR